MQLYATPILYCEPVGVGWGAGPAEKGKGAEISKPLQASPVSLHGAWGSGLYSVGAATTLRSPGSHFALESGLRGVCC